MSCTRRLTKAIQKIKYYGQITSSESANESTECFQKQYHYFEPSSNIN